MKNEYLFKTTINCGSCVAKVKPKLDGLESVAEWQVDTDHPDKILKIQTSGTADEVVNTLDNIGYKAERL